MRTKVPQKTSWKELLTMMMTIALPVAMQNLLSTTGSMVDTIMLGRLGETTVGAVGLCAQFTSLMFSGYWGFIGGGMLFIAQFWGEGNHDGIRKSYGIMLAFVAMTATAATYLALCKPMWVMQLYTNSETIQKIGVEYLSLVGFSYVFQVLAVAMSALLRSVERVKIPLAGEIAAEFNMTKPSISNHLSILKQADLVDSEKIGQNVIYSLKTSVLEDMLKMLSDLTGREDK